MFYLHLRQVLPISGDAETGEIVLLKVDRPQQRCLTRLPTLSSTTCLQVLPSLIKFR